jgi:hypothetical protein
VGPIDFAGAVSKGPDVEMPDVKDRRVGLYIDAEGNPTDDPRKAVRGEVLEPEEKGSPKRTWFFVDEVEIKWLPMSEGAFLLWVLVALVALWVGIAVLLRLF